MAQTGRARLVDERAALGPPRVRAGPLLRNLRPRLPAQRAGDLRSPRRRGRRRRATPVRLGATAQLVGRPAADAATGGGRAQPRPVARGRAKRRGPHRRVPRALRHDSGPAGRPGPARRLQPARVALRHARRRSRALPGRNGRRRRGASHRPARLPQGGRRRRRHRGARAVLSRGVRPRARASGGVLRRRRGSPLPARPSAGGAVPRPLRGQADSPARARDHSRGCRARARRSRFASSAAASSSRSSPSGPRTSSGCRGSSTTTSRARSGRPAARSGVFGTSAKAGRVIPNKAFQALACATPLVTAATPGAHELLTDGQDALLVPAGDPSALAAAVRRLAGDAALARPDR